MFATFQAVGKRTSKVPTSRLIFARTQVSTEAGRASGASGPMVKKHTLSPRVGGKCENHRESGNMASFFFRF